MSQHKRCETCYKGGPERNERGLIVCQMFDDEHNAYDKCDYWKDIDVMLKKSKRKK